MPLPPEAVGLALVLNVEKIFAVCMLSQWGQVIGGDAADARSVRRSKTAPHSLHWYSKIGIPHLPSSYTIVLCVGCKARERERRWQGTTAAPDYHCML